MSNRSISKKENRKSNDQRESAKYTTGDRSQTKEIKEKSKDNIFGKS